jgi:hypothetical protein
MKVPDRFQALSLNKTIFSLLTDNFSPLLTIPLKKNLCSKTKSGYGQLWQLLFYCSDGFRST